eukprot:GHVU01102742.1.p1 GENE.GHVU01102742.1~~GHVU01102742.1.p1  ORF type:complete len:125 (-),score=1.65 GHVU01102742.1:31-405(-)
MRGTTHCTLVGRWTTHSTGGVLEERPALPSFALYGGIWEHRVFSLFASALGRFPLSWLRQRLCPSSSPASCFPFAFSSMSSLFSAFLVVLDYLCLVVVLSSFSFSFSSGQPRNGSHILCYSIEE